MSKPSILLIPTIHGYLVETIPDWKDRCKITLNMTDGNGKRLVDVLKTDGLEAVEAEKRSYWSHFQGKRNFSVGDIVLGFIQLENRDEWLFAAAGIIEEIPTEPGYCKHRELKELECFKGRLILKIDKGNTYSRYVFKLNSLNKKHPLEVHEVLTHELAEEVEFLGYNRCRWDVETLLKILDGSKRHASILARLKEVKGVYLLKDRKTGKEYYGSAYGRNGFAQRWKSYLDTSTGGNKGLVDLYNKLGSEYFKDNFVFSIQDVFPLNAPNQDVLEQEAWRKNEHMSREFGYNCN